MATLATQDNAHHVDYRRVVPSSGSNKMSRSEVEHKARAPLLAGAFVVKGLRRVVTNIENSRGTCTIVSYFVCIKICGRDPGL